MKLFLVALILGLAAATPDAPAGRAPADGTRGGDSFAWQSWWRRNGPWLLAEVGSETPPSWSPPRARGWLALPENFEAGAGGGKTAAREVLPDVFDLLGLVRSDGDEGLAAVLELGLRADIEVAGHLRSLLEDRLVGRALAGDPERPVAPERRSAAALALGLSGQVRGYQGLRMLLLDPAVEDGLGAAAILGLSFSASASDAHRLGAWLGRGSDRPLMAEAAAVALGRLAGENGEAARVLAGALAGGEASAARGAAVGLWYPGSEEALTSDALAAAAVAAADEGTRRLAVLALAGRGDPRAEALLDPFLTSSPDASALGALAAGLYARGRPEARGWAEGRLSVLRGTVDPSALASAWQLLEPGPSRPSPARSLASLAGASPALGAATDLGRLLDLAARCGRGR